MNKNQSVKFQIVHEDALPGDYGSWEDACPYVHLADPTYCLGHMIDAHEIVITESSIKVVLDYPLTRPFLFELHEVDYRSARPTWMPESYAGFTRSQLAKAISCTYQLVYNEEDRTSTELAQQLRGRYLNTSRGVTDGTYKIWGHELHDLDLIEVWRPLSSGTGYWFLEVDS